MARPKTQLQAIRAWQAHIATTRANMQRVTLAARLATLEMEKFQEAWHRSGARAARDSM